MSCLLFISRLLRIGKLENWRIGDKRTQANTNDHSKTFGPPQLLLVTDISSSLRNKGLPQLNGLLLFSFNSRCSSPLGFFLPPYRLFLLFRKLCSLFGCFGFFFSLKLFLLFLPCSFFCFGFPLFDLCLFLFR